MARTRRRRNHYTPYSVIALDRAYHAMRILCAIIVGIPILLCCISFWGILFEGLFAGGEYAASCIPQGIGALIVFGVAALFTSLSAWYSEDFTFLRSLIPSYLISAVGMFVVLAILPVKLSAALEGSVFAAIAGFVVNCVVGVSAAFLPALLASIVGWSIRAGYYLFRPEV